MSVGLKVQLLSDFAQVPHYTRDGDAAKDIRSVESVDIAPNETVMVHTGLAFEIPEGFVMHIYGRSGLASRGLSVSNGVGVIDSNYRGEVCVLLTNNSVNSIHISLGDRIAQITIDKVIDFHSEVVDILSDTNRGDNGFGSSGNA